MAGTVHRTDDREAHMALARVRSRALQGLQARPVNVEVHLANGLPGFTLVVCQLDSPTEPQKQERRPKAPLSPCGAAQCT